MSVLGKILALLNIVAAAVFAWMAIQDYARHKNWSYAIAKLEQQQEGLPTDEKETDVQGRVRVEDFDQYTVRGLPQLDGQPLTNQEKYMRDAERKVKQKVDSSGPLPARGLPDPLTTKTQKLAWALRPLATTFARRNALYHVMQGREPTLLDAVGIFDSTRISATGEARCAYDVEIAPKLRKLEEEGLADKEVEETKRRQIIAEAIPARLEKDFADAFNIYGLPERERRQAFAGLLFATCDLLRDDEQPAAASLVDSKTFAGTMAVIGVRAAVDQINIQADILRRMVYECDLQLERDRDLFVQEHKAKLDRIIVLKRALADLVKQREAKAKDVEVQKNLIKTQEEVIKRVEEDLKKARADTVELLTTKAEKERVIIAQQAELRRAMDSVQSLATDLRQLEERFPRREAQPR